eukprot:g1933.t1
MSGSLKKWVGRKLDPWLEGSTRSADLLKDVGVAGLARGELSLHGMELNRSRMAEALALPPLAAGGRVRVRRAYCESVRLKVPSWYSLRKLSQRRASVAMSQLVLELEDVGAGAAAASAAGSAGVAYTAAMPPPPAPESTLAVAIRCGALCTAERIVVRVFLRADAAAAAEGMEGMEGAGTASVGGGRTVSELWKFGCVGASAGADELLAEELMSQLVSTKLQLVESVAQLDELRAELRHAKGLLAAVNARGNANACWLGVVPVPSDERDKGWDGELVDM